MGKNYKHVPCGTIITQDELETEGYCHKYGCPDKEHFIYERVIRYNIKLEAEDIQ